MKTDRCFFLALILASCAAPLAASGGDRERGGSSVGNGGDAVICYRGAPKVLLPGIDDPFLMMDVTGAPVPLMSVEIADYWEHLGGDASLRKYRLMENANRYELDLGGAGLSPLEKARLALTRLAAVDAAMGERLLRRLDEFEASVVMVEGASLADVHDARYAIDPEQGCFFRQFAVQFRDLKTGRTSFLVNRELFDAADADNKAGLILHELIYEDLIATRGEQSSDRVRLFNFMISSTFMQDADRFRARDALELLESFASAR